MNSNDNTLINESINNSTNEILVNKLIVIEATTEREEQASTETSTQASTQTSTREEKQEEQVSTQTSTREEEEGWEQDNNDIANNANEYGEINYVSNPHISKIDDDDDINRQANDYINSGAYPNELVFMNDIDYIKFYDDQTLNLIQLEIIPYLYQFDTLNESEFYSSMVSRMYELSYSFEEIYYGIGVYLMLGQHNVDNSEQVMCIVKKTILRIFIRIENSHQSMQNQRRQTLSGPSPGIEEFREEFREEFSEELINSLNELNSNMSDFVGQTFLQMGFNFPITSNNLNALINLNHHVNLNPNLNYSSLEPVKLTVQKSELDKIPIVEFNSLREEIQQKNIACTICLDEFEANTNVRHVKCGHVFHTECIDKWLLENSYKCPTCREEVADHVANIDSDGPTFLNPHNIHDHDFLPLNDDEDDDDIDEDDIDDDDDIDNIDDIE